MTRKQWIFTGFGLILAIPLLVLAGLWLFLASDGARDWVASAATSRLGQEVRIDGAFTLTLGDPLQFRAETVRIGDMADIGLISGAIRIWPLLRGDVSLTNLLIERPQIKLAQTTKAPAKENPPPAKSGGTVRLPYIDQIVVTDGVISHGPPDSPDRQVIRIKRLDGGLTPQTMRLAASGGREGGDDVGLELTATADQGNGWPVQGHILIEETRASVDGLVRDPFALSGVDLGFSLAGPDLVDLGRLLGLALPRSRGYEMTARLTDDASGWRFADIKGRVGESDVAGTLHLDVSGLRTRLTGNLGSEKLAALDLAGLFGASPRGAGDYPTRGRGRVLPATEVNIAGLRAIDADITVKGQRVEAPFSPFDGVEARIRVDAGRMVVEPLKVGIGGGQMTGRAQLDGSGEVASLGIDLILRSIKLASLFRETPFAREMGGTLHGAIQLDGSGPTVADILAKSTGKAGFAVHGGRITSLAVKGLKTNILETLGVVLAGDEPLPFNCLVADLVIRNGVGRVQALVLDTPETLVTGGGTINFDSEKLALRIEGDAKEVQIFATHVPVVIGGSFANPALTLDGAETATRGAAAVALGALLTPLAALIPLLDDGTDETVSCKTLVQRARNSKTPAR